MTTADALREQLGQLFDGADDPGQVAALATLWVLWLGGTLAFAEVGRVVAGVDVPVPGVGSALVTPTLVVATVVVVRREC